MALTMLRGSPESGCHVGIDVVTPAMRAEGTRTMMVLRGEMDVSARPVLCEVLSLVIGLGAGEVVIDLAEALAGTKSRRN